MSQIQCASISSLLRVAFLDKTSSLANSFFAKMGGSNTNVKAHLQFFLILCFDIAHP